MESFTDFVVGHGELWSASMLSAVIRKVWHFLFFIFFIFLKCRLPILLSICDTDCLKCFLRGVLIASGWIQGKF